MNIVYDDLRKGKVMHLEFRQLEYFCMISKFENFTRAAELLHVSQPSVTKSIKTLEAELKITLIDRSQKHVTLTPEGKVFLVHAEKILRDMEDAIQDMGKFQTNDQSVLKLGIPPMVEAYLFPDIFKSFKHLYPNIELYIEEYVSSSNVQHKLEEGEIDLGIILSHDKKSSNSVTLLQDELNLCVNHDHPLRKKRFVEFSQLKNEKFILQHPNTYQYKAIYDRCMENGFTPDILLCTAQLKTIKQLVANQSGISLLLNMVTNNNTDFSVVPVAPPITVNISLIWSPNKYLSQASQKFVDFIRNYVHSPDFKASVTNHELAAPPYKVRMKKYG